MKVLGKIIILIFLFVSCKKVDEQNKKDNISISKSNLEIIEDITPKDNNINIFLKTTIEIINRGNENEIKSILIFPFYGYTLGGSEITYSDFESLTTSNEVYENFINLKHAVGIEAGKEKEMYWIDIKISNGYEASNLYRINKLKGKYKFVGMQLSF